MKISHINNQEQNTLRNTLISAGVGLAGGAYVGRLATTPLKDSKVSDEFIHNVMTACAEDADDVKFYDFAKSVAKIGEKPTAEEYKTVQNYLLENAEALDISAENAADLKKIDFKNAPDNVKASMNSYIDNLKKGYGEALDEVKEAFGKVYDTSKKSFKKLAEDSSDDLKDFSEISKKVLNDAKTKNAWKFGGVGLLAAGAAAWIATKISEKN